MHRTAEELIRFLEDKGISLDLNTIRRNQINGRRVLFSMAKEFPDAEAAAQALDRLRSIHEEALL